MRLNKYDFHCPKCGERIDTKGVIHLLTKRGNGDCGDIFLSTTFGNYSYKNSPDVDFEVGESVDFSCPKCHENLKSKKHPDFVSLIMKVENQFDFEILFSRFSGIQKTYIITEDGLECYGQDCEMRVGKVI